MEKEIIFRWESGAFLISQDNELFDLIKQGGNPTEIELRLSPSDDCECDITHPDLCSECYKKEIQVCYQEKPSDQEPVPSAAKSSSS